MVKITLQRISDLLGDECDKILRWIEKNKPDVFKRMILDIEFDKKSKSLYKEELISSLHDYFAEWKKIKQEYGKD